MQPRKHNYQIEFPEGRKPNEFINEMNGQILLVGILGIQREFRYTFILSKVTEGAVLVTVWMLRNVGKLRR